MDAGAPVEWFLKSRFGGQTYSNDIQLPVGWENELEAAAEEAAEAEAAAAEAAANAKGNVKGKGKPVAE